jgi:hypothetical protein
LKSQNICGQFQRILGREMLLKEKEMNMKKEIERKGRANLFFGMEYHCLTIRKSYLSNQVILNPKKFGPAIG